MINGWNQFQHGEKPIKSNNHNCVGNWILKGDKNKTENGHKKIKPISWPEQQKKIFYCFSSNQTKV